MELKSIFSRHTKKKDVYHREFADPNRDWARGLLTAIIFFIGAMVYVSVDFYLQFLAPNDEIMVDVEPVVYKDKDVVFYAEVYAERDVLFNTLRETRAYVPPQESAEDREVPLAEEVVSQ